jgi:hypothetical protein
MFRRALPLVLVVGSLSGSAIAAQAQQPTRIVEAAARAIVAATALKYPKPDARFRTSCAQQLQRINRHFVAGGQSLNRVVSSGLIRLWVDGPANRVCDAASELMRKMEPLDALEWSDEIRVNVSALTFNAPDVFKVVVTRDGVVMDQLPTSTLSFQPVTNAMGAETLVPGGWASYPLGAFAPGAQVVVTAITNTAGINFHRTFSDGDLRKIQ